MGSHKQYLAWDPINKSPDLAKMFSGSHLLELVYCTQCACRWCLISCSQSLIAVAKHCPIKPSLILVILPPGRDKLRRQAKYWGNVPNRIPTQCVVRDTIVFTVRLLLTLFGMQKAGKYDKERGQAQYCRNLALKYISGFISFWIIRFSLLQDHHEGWR